MGALKSKTMWFNALVAVLAVLEMQGSLLQQVVGVQHFGHVMLGLAMVNAALRVVTTQALSEK